MEDITKTGPVGLEGMNGLNQSPSTYSQYFENLGRMSTSQLSRAYMSPASEDVGVQLAEAGYGSSSYDDAVTSMTQLEDLNELRAQEQPWYAQVASGLAKGAILAGTTFLDGTIGLLMGTGQGIANLADDIALNLAAETIRIEAPIPGKQAVGIEVPNKEKEVVHFREILDRDEFRENKSKLTVGVGKDVAGNVQLADIAKMPHVLIAGSTGSGKSVCINTIITSIIYNAKPSEVKFVMVDPKVVELSVYNGIPHLLIPVVTDPRKAAGALAWAVQEMDDRYNKFASKGVRDLKGYNKIIEKESEEGAGKLPQIVIIIDELADLMMVAKNDVEDAICRLAQKARAAGMHLVIATQRPSVDVITGLIKANVPSRIAFAVSSQVDSRTILDSVGAEKLLGKGDMLFFPSGAPKPSRVQGAFVSDDEVEKIVDFIKSNGTATYSEDILESIENSNKTDKEIAAEVDPDDDTDPFLMDAIQTVVETGQASTSFIQRRFKVGYARAGRIVDQMEERGVISGYQGSKPREVLMTLEKLQELKMGNKQEV